jgi:hypothetical protein
VATLQRPQAELEAPAGLGLDRPCGHSNRMTGDIRPLSKKRGRWHRFGGNDNQYAELTPPTPAGARDPTTKFKTVVGDSGYRVTR